MVICLSVDLAYPDYLSCKLRADVSNGVCSCGFILIVMWRYSASDTLEWLADSDIKFSHFIGVGRHSGRSYRRGEHSKEVYSRFT